MPRIRKAAAMASDNTCCDNTMEQRLSEDIQSDFRKAIRKFHQAITAGQRNFFNCVNEELFNEVRLSRIRNLTQKAKELLHIVEINLDSDGFWDFPIPDPVPTYIADTMISSDKVDSFAELSQRASQLGFCVTARVVHFVRWGYGMNLRRGEVLQIGVSELAEPLDPVRANYGFPRNHPVTLVARHHVPPRKRSDTSFPTC